MTVAEENEFATIMATTGKFRGVVRFGKEFETRMQSLTNEIAFHAKVELLLPRQIF